MATYNKFNVFVEHLAEAVHNFESNIYKVMLTNAAPIATNGNTSQLTEISAGNGYVANGQTVIVTGSSQTSGTYKLTIDDCVFEANGGTVGPFRYVVLYKYSPTPPARPLVAWWDYGSSVTLNNGETFTVDFDASAGVFTIT